MTTPAMTDLWSAARAWAAWEAPRATACVERDRFDDAILSEVIAESPHVSEYRDDLAVDFAHADDLVSDLGALLFKPDPSIREPLALAPSVHPSRALVAQAWNTPEMESLRQHTVYNRWNTALALDAMREALAGVTESLKEQADAAQQAEQARDEAQQAVRDAVAELDAGGDPDPAAVAQALQALADAQAQAQQGSASEQVMAARASAALRQAVKETAEKVEAEATGAAAWGIGAGDLERMDAAERMRLSAALTTPRMRRFLRLFGRMQMTALSETARNVEGGRDEAFAVTLGADVSDMLGSEMARLTNRMLRLDLLRRIGEGQVLVREWRGVEKAEKGPILVLLDVSGSMGAGVGNTGETREAWAKACALAVMTLARKQGRALVTVLFDTQVHVVEGTGWQQALEVGEWFTGGGTDFELALSTGLDAITRLPSMERADILFLTDGDADVSASFKARYDAMREETGARAWGVSVGIPRPPSLIPLCDNVRSVADLADTQGVVDIFRSI